MGEKWDVGRMIRVDNSPSYIEAPPGLLLSLGDGSAVTVSAEMLADALARVRLNPADNLEIAQDAIAALIQQAQEARDARS